MSVRRTHSTPMPPPGAAKPRPVLLFIVYGVFLVIVGVTATAQVVLASTHFSTAVLNHTVGTDAQIVRGFVNERLAPSDLQGDAMPDARRAALAAELAGFSTRRGILHLEVRRLDGSVMVSSAPVATGFRAPASDDWLAALDGEVAVSVVDVASSEAGVPELGSASLLREYFPLVRDGRAVGVVALWRDGSPIVSALTDVRRDVVVVTVTAALAAAFVLFLVFRSAQGRISRQTVALLESTRRDPLTGLLNHGALLEALATTTERVRGEGGVAVALLDIDNFRSLNDTWGHPAGDAAIRAVAEELASRVGEGWLLGRYGPDEFLVACEGRTSAPIETMLQDVREALRAVDLRFADSERLPLTVSGALSSYPEHGSSVTELLANTAVTLTEAKTGGGDAIRHTSGDTGESPEARTFDVFQGLILAVDAKDRYTKRHSEDVARYAVFLAARLGLPEEDLRVIRMAGLLHDVGKIGIPDQILRKPGKLTDGEYAIVQQHVALGDAIVRDLANLEQIRAGIRHHHERWDGKGYLHRLEGEEIPLVARILAVCDTFSAMTTSRPYRKALPLEEALRRLGDAADTQLDGRLVRSFVEGVETDPHPPLPGDDAPASLWLPDAERLIRVA